MSRRWYVFLRLVGVNRMDIRRWIVALTVVVMATGGAISAKSPVEASHFLSPTKVHVGDVMVYEMRVTYDANVALLDVGAEAIKAPLSVLKFSKDRERQGAQIVFKYLANVTAFEVDGALIQSRTIRYRLDGQVYTLVLPEIKVDVVSVLTVTNNQLQDIKRADRLAFPVAQVGGMIAIIVLIGLGGGAFLFMRRRSDDLPVQVVELQDNRTLEQKTLERLTVLRRLPFEPGPFYVELSTILREYVGGRYEVSSTEMTTDELITSLKGRCDAPILQRIKNLLQLSDWVKFAKFVPSKSDSDAALDAVLGIIDDIVHSAPVEDNHEIR